MITLAIYLLMLAAATGALICAAKSAKPARTRFEDINAMREISARINFN